MNQIKTGALIRKLRNERGLTQKQLADRIHVSDKAVSKWECGSGCPDVSLLSDLAEALGTEPGVLLSGEIDKHEREKGNMKKLKFYVCRACGNIITAASDASVICCGTKLSALEPRRAEAHEMLNVEDCGGEWYITADHPMTKEHYISFAAFLTDSSVTVCKQYPEWNMQVTLPIQRAGRLVWYCSVCGLLYQDIRP